MKSKFLFNTIVILVMLLALVPAGGGAKASSVPEGAPPEEGSYVPGEVVVGFEGGINALNLDAKAGAMAGSVGAQVAKVGGGMALLSFDPAQDVMAMVDQLKGTEGTTFVEPNYILSIPEVIKGDPDKAAAKTINTRDQKGEMHVRSAEALKEMRTLVRKNGRTLSIPTYPSDWYWPWGHFAINAQIIWPEKKPSPTVCVIDTGADVNHPDLKGNVLNGYDFVNDDKIANDDNGHGTHVAGVIASKTNNKLGTWGVSNGKVLAVKVLNAQGSGTSYNVALGVWYCANSSAKVISMSLGGPSSAAEYSALNYAINVKYKLLAAAAGNSSSNNRSYPAGYATDPGIGAGILSVGAATSDIISVDTDGDNVLETGESFYDCAANFSNYGNWVKIVAPGVDVLSTTPASYPFWMQYAYDVSAGYDTMSGTSMATPYVSAAAARVWSLNPTQTGAGIATLLINNGNSLNLAVDPSVASATNGYNTSGYAGDGPYCWPNATAPYGSNQDMSNARYLNVAAAMNRGALEFDLRDAQSGMPLKGATIKAVDSVSKKVYDTSRLDNPYVEGGYTSGWIDLINLPTFKDMDIQVSMKGYTSGFQTLWYGWVSFPGWTYWDSDYSVLPIPASKHFTVVMNSWPGAPAVDQFVFLPAGSPNGSIGYMGSPLPYAVNDQTLFAWPYAIYNRDNFYDGIDITSTTIGAVGSKPHYPGDYSIFLNAPNTTLNNAYPIVRIWYNGKLLTIWDGSPNSSCAAGQTWVKVGRLFTYGSGAGWQRDGTCGTSALLPY